MVKKVLPRHSSCLDLRNYLIYLRSIIEPFENRSLQMEKIWEPLLGPCHITSAPTGRHALWYYLDIAGLKKGDEVLVSAYNFYVVIQLLVQRGLIPKFVDIDPETLCMEPDDLAKKVTDKSRLVLVTHMFGNPSDLKKIALICKKHNLLLFEDCAHGIRSYCGEKHVGTESDGALFSFGIYKIINSFGGGMLVQRNSQTSNINHIDSSQALSGVKSFIDSFIRFVISSLMTPTLHTVILYPLLKLSKQYIPQLYHMIEPSKSDPDYLFEIDNRAPFKPFMLKMIKHQLLTLDENISRRKEIAEKIKSELKDIEGINVLNENKFGRSNYSYFGIYVADPETMAKHLEVNRVIANPHEYYDCSNLPQFSDYKSRCKHASYAEKHSLTLTQLPLSSG